MCFVFDEAHFCGNAGTGLLLGRMGLLACVVGMAFFFGFA